MGLGWARQRGTVGFAGSPLLCPGVTPGGWGWGFPVPRGGSGSPWGGGLAERSSDTQSCTCVRSAAQFFLYRSSSVSLLLSLQ